MGQGVRETKLVRFLPHAEKGEIGLVAGQPQTDAGVGPAGADGFRDPAMVMGMMHDAGEDVAAWPDRATRRGTAARPSRARGRPSGAWRRRRPGSSSHSSQAPARFPRPSRPGAVTDNTVLVACSESDGPRPRFLPIHRNAPGALPPRAPSLAPSVRGPLGWTASRR